MKESANNDNTLLVNAQERVKLLLSDYVLGIGKVINVNYTIKWNYI